MAGALGLRARHAPYLVCGLGATATDRALVRRKAARLLRQVDLGSTLQGLPLESGCYLG